MDGSARDESIIWQVGVPHGETVWLAERESGSQNRVLQTKLQSKNKN